MNIIECPNCGKEIELDDAGYANILNQVKNDEFNKELAERLSQVNQVKEAEARALEAHLKQEFEAEKAKIQTTSELAILSLKNELEKAKTEKELAVVTATTEIQQKRTEAETALELLKAQSTLDLKNQKELSEGLIKLKDGEIEGLRQMKAQLSTKMIGETLELHCANSFNLLRSAGFPNAYFDKDNDSAAGTKGDYVFRDFDDNKVEIVSIMFEMKDEAENTDKKQKNEKFLEKLDKDRLQKTCEYAILVTTLEKENELYNSGIVDVSHKYPKMYVIRPQFFVPMITLLRNAALGAMQYKTELALARQETIEVTNFESALMEFKRRMANNWKDYSNNANGAIDQIDAAIASLEAVKKSLRLAMKHLGSLSSNSEKITIRTLTENSPSIEAKFKELRSGSGKKLPELEVLDDEE
jgi:hypothetical protein